MRMNKQQQRHDSQVARYLRSLDDEARRENIDRIARVMHAMDQSPIAVAITVQPASMIDPIDSRRI